MATIDELLKRLREDKKVLQEIMPQEPKPLSFTERLERRLQGGQEEVEQADTPSLTDRLFSRLHGETAQTVDSPADEIFRFRDNDFIPRDTGFSDRVTPQFTLPEDITPLEPEPFRGAEDFFGATDAVTGPFPGTTEARDISEHMAPTGSIDRGETLTVDQWNLEMARIRNTPEFKKAAREARATEERRVLGIRQSEMIKAGGPIVQAVTAPLFKVGDFPVSATDLVLVGSLLTGLWVGSAPLRANVSFNRLPERQALVSRAQELGISRNSPVFKDAETALKWAFDLHKSGQTKAADALMRQFRSAYQRGTPAGRTAPTGTRPAPTAGEPFVPRATQTGAMAQGTLPTELTNVLWDNAPIAQKVANVNVAGLAPSVANKPWEALTSEEKQALSNIAPVPSTAANNIAIKISQGLKLNTTEEEFRVNNADAIENQLASLRAQPETTTPVTEVGQPEAGLQKGMFGEDKVVRPAGKGVTTQASLDDQLKLDQARGAVTPEVSEKVRRARIKELIEQAKPFVEKEGLTPSEAAEFKALSKEIRDIQFSLVKPLDVTKIKSAVDRKSTLTPEVIGVAHSELIKDKAIFEVLVEGSEGVAFDAFTPADRILARQNPDISPRQLYNAFQSTRDVLRQQHGDTIKLFRATGKQIEKPTTNWATTEAFAKQFGEDVISREIPIDNVIAVNVGLRGNYHELIVGQPQPTQPVTPEVKTVPKAATAEVEAVHKQGAIAPAEGRITQPEPNPPDKQPPSNPIEESMLEGVPTEWEGLMPNLRSAQVVHDLMTKQDDWKVFANLPIVKQIMSHFNPSAVADSPHLKYKIVRSVLRFESAQRGKAVMSHLNRLGGQQRLFGKLDDRGLIASGPLKGLGVNDIRANPNKYRDKLTQAQKEWITSANEIEHAKLDFLKRNDIKINELLFDEGGEYAGRRWLFKVTSDGTLVEAGTVGAGPGKPGKRMGFEKQRTFKSQKEGIDAGYFPMNDDQALALNVQGAYNRVADKQAADWLLTQVDWRTTSAPDDLVLAAESAKLKTQQSQRLLAGINRAVRGERVPPATINAIASVYPEEAQRLKNLIPKLQAGKPTSKEVQSLTARANELIGIARKEQLQAVNARARAREIAMKVGADEGMIAAPAFAGKIFKGPEARELTSAINKELQSTVLEIVRGLNKVNAISRYFMLAGDLSPVAIQLIFLAGANPKVYGNAALGMLRGIFDPRFLSNYYNNNREVINASPDLILSSGGSTEFTEAGAKGGLVSSAIKLTRKEESFLKNLGLIGPRALGKTGATVLEPFMRGFESALDVAGIELKKSLMHMGVSPKAMEEVDMFCNEIRGLASSDRIGVSPNWRAGETLAVLASQYNRAIASLLFDTLRGNLRGKLVRNALARGIFAIVMVTVAVSLARREDPLDHLDPTETDFLTWNIEGQQIGPGSKVRSLIRLAGQWTKAIQEGNADTLIELSMDNPNMRFLRGNLSPVAGASVDLLTGQNFIGDPTRDGVLSFSKEILLSNLTPIWVENVAMEGGSVKERALRGLAEFLGGRAYPETTWDKVKPLREKYAKEDYGSDYASLNSAEIQELRRNHPDLADIERDAKEEWAQKGTDFERWYFDENERVTKERDDNLDFAAQSFLDGKIGNTEYNGQRKYIRPFYSGGKAVLWSARTYLDPKSSERIERWMNENQAPEDRLLDSYLELQADLLDKADLPIDWGFINSQLAAFLGAIPPSHKEYILENKDNWIKDLPPSAKAVETMRLEDYDFISNFRIQVNDLVFSSYWDVPTMQEQRDQGKKAIDMRGALRVAYPQLDANLAFWFDHVSTVKTQAAANLLAEKADDIGRPRESIPALADIMESNESAGETLSFSERLKKRLSEMGLQ